MRVRVMTDAGEEIEGTFLLRLSGWTEERYFQEAPEDRIWEFEDGEVTVHSPATLHHQRRVGFLTFLLKGYVEARGLGEVLNGPAVLRLRPGAAKEPDLFFIHRDRRSGIREEWVDGPADWVIEVSSPGTWRYDREEKARVYQEGSEGIRGGGSRATGGADPPSGSSRISGGRDLGGPPGLDRRSRILDRGGVAVEAPPSFCPGLPSPDPWPRRPGGGGLNGWGADGFIIPPHLEPWAQIPAKEVQRCLVNVKGKVGGSQRLAREGSLAGDEGGGSPHTRG